MRNEPLGGDSAGALAMLGASLIWGFAVETTASALDSPQVAPPGWTERCAPPRAACSSVTARAGRPGLVRGPGRPAVELAKSTKWLPWPGSSRSLCRGATRRRPAVGARESPDDNPLTRWFLVWSRWPAGASGWPSTRWCRTGSAATR